MKTSSKIESIILKLSQLKELDSKKDVFGATSHMYSINGAKTEAELQAFEQRNGIKLPEDYRMFLLKIGDGGAGPYYGLETLENSLYVDLDYKREDDQLDPSKPFMLSEPWNMTFEGDLSSEQKRNEFQEAYSHNRWVNGLLRICNYGCGVSLNLVVNGAEYGNIWVDDRGNDGGIYPDAYFGQKDRTQFLNWYELWLDISIKEVNA